MIRAVVIGDAGTALDQVVDALAHTPEIAVAGRLNCRRPIVDALTRMAPDVTVIQEPTWSPLPEALIREARHAAPRAALIVRAADATPTWVAEALNAGATAVLPATVGATALGRVVAEIVTEHDTAHEALRFGWAA